MWAARILLVGILVIASIAILSTAIAFAAPYLAALVILWGLGKWCLNKLQDTKPPEPP